MPWTVREPDTTPLNKRKKLSERCGALLMFSVLPRHTWDVADDDASEFL